MCALFQMFTRDRSRAKQGWVAQQGCVAQQGWEVQYSYYQPLAAIEQKEIDGALRWGHRNEKCNALLSWT
jgi:hypothetical protein